jgi:FlaG/FlaF family flagellin (archaellin)
MVAIVVILAATISVFALGFTDEANQPGPVVGQSSGELLAFEDDSDEQIVRITHIAGDSITVSDIEIPVRAECKDGTKQGRIVNLPAEDGNDIDENDDGQSQIEGENIFSQSSLTTIDNKVDGVSDGGALLHGDGQYTAGESIIFRISKGDCEIATNGQVTVRIVHTPTNSVVIKQTLTAT